MDQGEVSAGSAEVVISRRRVGKGILLSASAVAAAAAASRSETVHAAPVTDPWRLGGNDNVATDGTNFLGTKNVAPLIFKTTKRVGSTPVERMRIGPGGNVGIGTTSPNALLHVRTNSVAPSVLGENQSTGAGAAGLQGKLTSTNPGSDAAGVLGTNGGTNGNGAGVRGTHAGSGIGVQGTTVNGIGVLGNNPATDANGTGVRGTHAGSGIGVEGWATNGTGVVGNGGPFGGVFRGSIYGVVGYGNSPNGYAAWFHNPGFDTSGVGVQGLGVGGADGWIHPGGSFYDGGGEFSGANGVIGACSRQGGAGVLGIQGPGTTAVTAQGTMLVTADLIVRGQKNFEIDHPLDPAGKILRHAALESSEVLNVYSGTVTLDDEGSATVVLPAWMEALNKDFRYQLTTVGGYAPVYVSEKLAGNQFGIAGGTAGLEVCWQLTGTRNDAYAQQHPLVVESDKVGDDRGKYLSPEAFGYEDDKSVGQRGHKRKKDPEIPAP